MAESRFALWAAPALLVVVALTQLVRAHSALSSPWKRGGFGMFSTIDTFGERGISCTVVDAAGESRKVSLPLSELWGDRPVETIGAAHSLRWHLNRKSMEDLARELRVEKLQEFGKAILSGGTLVALDAEESKYLEKFGDPEFARARGISLPEHFKLNPEDFFKVEPLKAPAPSALRTVRLRLWRYRFAPESATLSWEPLGDEVEVSAQ